MSMLVPLAKYQEAVGTSANPGRQTEAIEDASQHIQNYTDRDFAAPLVTEDREFVYEGGDLLEIDDAAAVFEVEGVGSGWEAFTEGPQSVAVYSYIILPSPLSPSAAALGFTRNLDRYEPGGPYYITVNASWGWPVVPDDVERATIWTAAAFENDPTSATGQLRSKSVAEVSEAYAVQETNRIGIGDEAIPARARAILEPYRRTMN